MRLIDTHCHINFPDRFPDVAATLRQALEAGVDRVITIGVDVDSSRRAVDLAEANTGVYAVVGCHPNYAATYDSTHLAIYRELWDHPKTVAIGEIGLDFHWDYATVEQQMAALHDQVDLARELDAPIVIHCREAYRDLLTFFEQVPQSPLLFHCFAGDSEDAARALALGATFGVDGPLTYKNGANLRTIVKDLPRDRVVVETDAPFMPPEPHRGKPNCPAWVSLVNNALAAVWGVSAEVSASMTTVNAERFFRL